MRKSNEPHCRKRKLVGVEQETSTVSVPTNKYRVEEKMELDRMSQDSTILFSHFPEEIWLLISNKIEDPNNLGNLMQASLVFRNLLLSRRVEFLFPRVWKALGIKFEKREEEVYSYNIDETRWCSRILRLRLVCKSWCLGVDEFYENLPNNDDYPNIHYRMEDDQVICSRTLYPSGEIIGNWTRNSNEFYAVHKIDVFLEHFDPTHLNNGNGRNPKIGRSICISFSHGHRANEILSLLSKYGHHIWFCELRLVSEQIRSRVEIYKELKEILQLLPNLKTLNAIYNHVPAGFRAPRNMGGNQKIKTPLESEILQLEQEITANPLPKLHQLKFLSVKDFPTSIFSALVFANSHISMLEILRDYFDDGYDIYTFPMPNLKKLSMEYFSKLEFENLYKPEVNWCLEKVYLNFRHCRLMPWSEIFSLLNCKWANTLKDVAIYTPFATRGSAGHKNVIDYGSSTTLNLPRVQRLRFFSDQFFSLDFIVPMKKLETLEVAVRSEYRLREEIVKQLRLVEKNQIIQFAGYFGRFQLSNIWNLFPNLNFFIVGKDRFHVTSFRTIYTREECERVARRAKIPCHKKYLWFR